MNLCENNGFYMYEKNNGVYKNGGFCGDIFDDKFNIMTFDITNIEKLTNEEIDIIINNGEVVIYTITPPRPSWTNNYGTEVIELNMITIGGNGLNA